MIGNCDNCKYEDLSVYAKPCNHCSVITEAKSNEWRPKDEIPGVAENETVSNESGGKQSKLEYRFDLIDPKSLFAIAKVMHEGAQKYEPDNWRKISVNDHLNHAISHIYAYLAGDKQDDHMEHAATRLLMGVAIHLENK